MTDNSNLSRRRFLQATGGAATAVALAGCTDNSDDGTSTSEGTTEQGTKTTTDSQGGQSSDANVLNLINSSIGTLDPIANTGTAGGYVITQVFETLLEYPNGKVEVKPLLVKDYSVDDSYTTYTFNLKKGATFHNGDKLTAEDLVYSFKRLAGSKNSRRVDYILKHMGVKHETNGDGSYKPGSLAVSAKDDHTFTMEIESPSHITKELLAYAAFSVVPKNIVGDIEGADGKMAYDEFSKNPVGSGPFKFKNWSSSTEVAVERFDDYHGEVAKLDGVHWQIIENSNAQFRTAMNKNVDAFALPTAHYDPNRLTLKEKGEGPIKTGTYDATNGSTLNVEQVPEVSTRYIAFNAQHVEKAARQAAFYAFNAEEVCQQFFKGRKLPGHQMTPPTIWPGGTKAYDKFAEENYPYGYNQAQLDKAREVMEKAGYSKDNKYEFTLSVYKGGTAYMDAATNLRDKLVNAHINVKVEEVPFNTMLKRGRNGKLEAWTLGWIMDWPTPDDFTQLIVPENTNTSEPGPLLYADWRGTEAAKKATKAWEKVQANQAPSEAAKKARAEANKKIEMANWEDAIALCFGHDLAQRYSYDWVDIPPKGGAGASRQRLNTATKSKK